MAEDAHALSAKIMQVIRAVQVRCPFSFVITISQQHKVFPIDTAVATPVTIPVAVAL
jgi:hypothetical protein